MRGERKYEARGAKKAELGRMPLRNIIEKSVF
jgi:hypothetical protein